MAKTPTVHNPTYFDPAQYTIQHYLDNQPPPFYGQSPDGHAADVANWKADMLAVFGPDWSSKIHHCAHCGNGRVRWITAVKHAPTGDTVVFGSDCTHRLGFANRQDWKLAALQAKAAGVAARAKLWLARQAFLTAHPAVAAAVAALPDAVHAKNSFAHDVLGKLTQYGTLSDKQVSAVLASMQRDVDFAAKKAADAAVPKGPAPVGRQTVTGQVLSTKVQDSQYGSTLKMLLQLGNGSRVWLTAPSRHDIDRGDTVTVTATFTASKDDVSFAFGSRPTGTVVQKPVVADATAVA